MIDLDLDFTYRMVVKYLGRYYAKKLLFGHLTNTPLAAKELTALGISGAARQAAVRIRAKALRDLDASIKSAIPVTLE